MRGIRQQTDARKSIRELKKCAAGLVWAEFIRRLEAAGNSTASVAESEAKRRGWANWDLKCTEDINHGWMHIVTAEITRRNAAEKPPELAH